MVSLENAKKSFFLAVNKKKKVTQLCSKNIFFAEKNRKLFLVKIHETMEKSLGAKKISHNKILCKGGGGNKETSKNYTIYIYIQPSRDVAVYAAQKIKNILFYAKNHVFFSVKKK
jgi:hypothetical protein